MHSAFGVLGVNIDKRVDRVEGIEQEVGIQLALQIVKLGTALGCKHLLPLLLHIFPFHRQPHSHGKAYGKYQHGTVAHNKRGRLKHMPQARPYCGCAVTTPRRRKPHPTRKIAQRHPDSKYDKIPKYETHYPALARRTQSLVDQNVIVDIKRQ